MNGNGNQMLMACTIDRDSNGRSNKQEANFGMRIIGRQLGRAKVNRI